MYRWEGRHFSLHWWKIFSFSPQDAYLLAPITGALLPWRLLAPGRTRRHAPHPVLFANATFFPVA
jgi:hypothetical protein